jgi:signal transduction histidine kinase
VSVGQHDNRAEKRAGVSDHAEEALEQQAATAEILHVIGNSPADLEPVFRTILSNASRLCQASVGAAFLFDGEVLTNVAHQNASPEFVQFLSRSGRRPSRETTTRRCALERRTVYTADLMNDPEYAPPEFQRRENVRAALSVPMIRNSVLIGVITLWRHVTTPFTERQIALVQTFADQAVIAIENARLFRELQARNVEITESLAQQTATAEILSVINSSPTDLQPVFDAILEKAIRLCGAHMGHLRLYDGERFVDVALRGAKAEYAQFLRQRGAFKPPKGGVYQRITVERQPIQIEDIRHSSEYRDGLRGVTALVELGGARSFIVVPMLKDGRVVGGISIYRPEVSPFTQKQIELVSTFANQAVIAIENVRLFKEIREALERQTAVSEILHVISGSPGDVARMLEVVAQHAVKLCESGEAGIFLSEDNQLKFVAGCQSGETFKPGETVALSRGSVLGRAVIDRETVHIVDLATADTGEFPIALDYQKRFGHRSLVAVPLMQKDRAIGVIGLWRFEVRGFSEQHIALVRTFADQAAIAIENVRLFNETREALAQQQALAEVLGAMSASIADTKLVFDRILDSCERLFQGHIVGLTLAGEDGLIRLGAYKGEHQERMQQVYPIPLARDSGSGQAILDQKVVHFPDVDAPGTPKHVVRGAQAAGFKSIIFVPMVDEGRSVGALWVARPRPVAFDEKATALLRTFGNQAVIAIRNSRLFHEIEEKSRQLEIASRHKSEFLANMSHELRTPLNAIIGFTRIVMRRSREQIETRQYENLEKILSSGQHLLALINSILDLAKVEAGRVEVDPTEIDVASLLESCVRTIEPLVKIDAVTLIKQFDSALPRMYVDEEKLRQIVINLLSNAAKFTARGSIRLQAHASNGSVAIAVTDTGIGIAPDKLDTIFEEFAQAEASNARIYGGTGLGLTIARRLARLMGGEIVAESALGDGSKFTLKLPLRYHSTGV